ncbi:hypothetical protein EJ05DRAFT_471552 [Pseudovirgaria hyperparasitica]|uniref:PH domain-containing protein n=1 Tax=Pseudovirgaria hyperparasitica TaxID=470096 RepID=A0A6A6WJS2_9PEZI|nr:uncharacterized protein EJ05DRAFT_471552 [Pseudovirgaria hyperparasitica]KAF2762555.1 hypothetical protein EJ05DRAFT_471552 [Pseudovirgaria hyperparasitica]
MTTYITKYAAKQLLGKNMEKFKHKDPAGEDDPFFTYIDHPRKKGKKKKVKKQVPDYIPEHDAVILAKMRQRAYWLDCSLFTLFGQRFGWSSVIGIIPGFGDVADALLALALFSRLRTCECGIDPTTQLQMLINILIDFVIGLIPILGDILDASFRANTRNLRLFERHLDKVYKPKTLRESERRQSKLGQQIPPPATEYAFFEDDEEEGLPRYEQDGGGSGVAQPAPVRQQDGGRAGNGVGAVYAAPAQDDPRRKKSVKKERR